MSPPVKELPIAHNPVHLYRLPLTRSNTKNRLKYSFQSVFNAVPALHFRDDKVSIAKIRLVPITVSQLKCALHILIGDWYKGICPRPAMLISLISSLPKKEKRKEHFPSSSLIRANLFRFSGRKNLATIVGTAILASSVGQARFAAFRAGNDAGHGELPMRATSLIPSRLGNLTLRNSHE